MITVRVIEYAVHTTAGDGGEDTSEVFCLVTDLPDVEEYPAPDLACCYPRRWGCEGKLIGPWPATVSNETATGVST